MLCGDEVGAIVADVGTLHSRFGSAGQDAPRYVFHSAAGINESNKATRRYNHSLSSFRNVQQKVDSEIISVMSPDGTMNYDVVSSIIDYGVSSCMRVDANDFPILMVENSFASKEDKYKLMEMFFEEFNFIGTYFPPTAMVASFCNGKPTGLVVDLGASHSTISPVVDGFVLEKSVTTTTRGGNWLDAEIRNILARDSIELKPWYEKDGFSVRNVETTASFRAFHVSELTRDLKHWMCFISATAISDDSPPHARVPYMPSYELPDGTAVAASEDLCLVTERLFAAGRTRVSPNAPAEKAPTETPGTKAQTPKAPTPTSASGSASSTAGSTTKLIRPGILSAALMPGVPTHHQKLDIDVELDPLHELIYASIAKCDTDCRKEMVSNIMLIGGGSLMDGLQPRLAAELTALLPAHLKPKLVTRLPVEQLNAPWIGGSILGICGTFQQMWISKEEYFENGPVPVLARSRG